MEHLDIIYNRKILLDINYNFPMRQLFKGCHESHGLQMKVVIIKTDKDTFYSYAKELLKVKQFAFGQFFPC